MTTQPEHDKNTSGPQRPRTRREQRMAERKIRRRARSLIPLTLAAVSLWGLIAVIVLDQITSSPAASAWFAAASSSLLAIAWVGGMLAWTNPMGFLSLKWRPWVQLGTFLIGLPAVLIDVTLRLATLLGS